MANKNLSRFDRISDKLKQKPSPEATERAAATHLFTTNNVLSGIASSKRKELVLYSVPPAQVRMWHEHNRRYDLLDEKRCADLIESFKRTGKQEFPAIVRRLSDDPNYDYELICGARRHWTATYLSWDLLIEVRELDDKQAFTLQDLENRDREDISDYERARDYQNALHKYFDGNRAAMSKFLEVDRGNLSRLLDLADLPKQIVDVYQDLRELKVHHAVVYKKLLSDNHTKRRFLDRARQLAKENLPGKRIFTELKKAVDLSDDVRAKPAEINVPGLSKPIQVISDSSGMTLKIPTIPEGKQDSVASAIAMFLGANSP